MGPFGIAFFTILEYKKGGIYYCRVMYACRFWFLIEDKLLNPCWFLQFSKLPFLTVSVQKQDTTISQITWVTIFNLTRSPHLDIFPGWPQGEWAWDSQAFYSDLRSHPNRKPHAGSCHKRQKPHAPTPQAPIRNRQTRKVANANGLNRNTNLT